MNLSKFRQHNLFLLLLKGEITKEYYDNYKFDHFAYIYSDKNNISLENESYYDEEENLLLKRHS